MSHFAMCIAGADAKHLRRAAGAGWYGSQPRRRHSNVGCVRRGQFLRTQHLVCRHLPALSGRTSFGISTVRQR